MKSTCLSASLTLLGAATAHAQDITLEIELPSLPVAEYHRPYVAVWIEGEGDKHQADVAVWYQLETQGAASEKGETWLKDLRKWWRTSGRNLEMPVDGLASATRPPGKHRIDVSKNVQALAQGDYTLIVEASREVGGREFVKIPFHWDGKSLQAKPVSGKDELGGVTLSAGS